MRFEDAIKIVLEHEGGYVNHPRDPGGETNMGITKKFYPHLNIRELQVEDAIQIYFTDFWERYQVGNLPGAIRLIFLDCAVNQGPGVAIGLLQAALGVQVDGALGPITIKKAHEVNPIKLVSAFARRRLQRYLNTKNFEHFGEGWLNRLVDVTAKTVGG